MIQIQNLTKSYFSKNSHFNALDNLSLTISDNSIFGVVGLSGAGKSTLIRCINRLEEPTSGNIIIHGVDITKLRRKDLLERRQKIGMIFQNFNLFHSRTVFENVAYPLEIAKKENAWIASKVSSLLETVGLSDKKDSYPATLSGGQKQRVAIARALANDPDILLCDEATSALDPQTTKSILSLIGKVKAERNLTVIMITHQMEVVREICDQVAIIEGGKIIEEGTVETVFAHPQKSTTKEFIRHLRPETVEEKITAPIGDMLIRLKFIGSNANKPILSNLIRQFDVEVIILSGNIDQLHHSQIGTLVLSLSGKKEERALALSYLNQQNVLWEEITND